MCSRKVISLLGEIQWFSNCGNPLRTQVHFDVEYVNSWADAVASCSRPNWEEITLEARNRLTSYLHEKYPRQLADWNKTAVEAKAVIQKSLDPVLQRVRDDNGLDQTFVDCAQWDILGAIMEHTCSVPGRPSFFTGLLAVYQSGNFPCGWSGKWPVGRLLVY